MKNEADYEQLYYDAIYENKKLKQKIKQLEDEIQEINICRTNKNIDLQQYLLLQFKKYKEE